MGGTVRKLTGEKKARAEAARAAEEAAQREAEFREQQREAEARQEALRKEQEGIMNANKLQQDLQMQNMEHAADDTADAGGVQVGDLAPKRKRRGNQGVSASLGLGV